MRQHREFLTFLGIWLVVSAVITPLVLILNPDLPPGRASDDAAGQVVDNDVLTAVALPLFLMVAVFLVYSIVRFRHTGQEIAEGPRLQGHDRLQMVWIAGSVVLVAGLFAYGTWRILEPSASGSGQGPDPLSPAKTVAGKPLLPVQVIGQQWQFTYRYPTSGGLQTPHLVLPVDRPVEFHVTSLDAIHSFWAYQLGVKADANPGVDNVAYVTPTRVGHFDVRCAELCGIWHGYMFDQGEVVTASEFESWIAAQQSFFEPVARYLPKYSETYLPAPARRGG
ncbi:MAG: cytochrome c oxidase subunit [Actinomycetota bacterium]|nr:cytochrome c oxidase subunit [Actinomycetota bacterium]